MNNLDAYQLLSSALAAYRELGYQSLVPLVGQTSSRLVRAADSTQYIVEVRVAWHNEGRSEVAVEGTVAIADCGPLGRLDESLIVRDDN